MRLAALATLLVTSACAPIAQLARDGASQQDFQRDRYQCLLEAKQVSGGSVGGLGSVSERPSHSLYLNCMSARGYRQVDAGGFTPDTPVPMNP